MYLLIYLGTLRQIWYGRFVTAKTPRRIYDGGYITALCDGGYLTADVSRNLDYGSCVKAKYHSTSTL